MTGATAAAAGIFLTLSFTGKLLGQIPTQSPAQSSAQSPGEAPAPAPTQPPQAAEPSPRTITLAEAIQGALKSDPAAAAAEASVSNAQAAVMEAQGAWLPDLTVRSGYTKASTQRIDQATGRLVSQNYSAQLVGDLEIFAGGKRWQESRAASASLAAARAENRAQRFQTILRATEVFYEAAAAADLERLAQQRLERARQQLSFAQTRFDVGTATSSDLLRAQLEQGNAELAVLDAQTSLRTAALNLGRLIGVAGEVHAVPASLPARAPVLPPTDTLIGRAERSAPSVISAEAELAGTQANKKAAIGGYLPSANLTGGYDWAAIDFPPDQRSWNLRVSASLPLFDGFQREASVQRAMAAERVARANVQDAAIAIRVSVESAVGEIESAARKVTISDHAVELAREDLRVLEERYQIGAATILDLQASQVSLAEAGVTAVRARQALGEAVAQLEAILGESIEEVTGD